jgi:hypothetical protein
MVAPHGKRRFGEICPQCQKAGRASCEQRRDNEAGGWRCCRCGYCWPDRLDAVTKITLGVLMVFLMALLIVLAAIFFGWLLV